MDSKLQETHNILIENHFSACTFHHKAISTIFEKGQGEKN